MLVNQQLHQQWSLGNRSEHPELSFENQQGGQQEWRYQQWRKVYSERKLKTKRKDQYGNLDWFLKTVFGWCFNWVVLVVGTNSVMGFDYEVTFVVVGSVRRTSRPKLCMK
jgi:hypothetical protein